MRLNFLPIITSEDAAFLYKEKRIEQFALYAPTRDEIERIERAISRIGIVKNDVFVLSRNKKWAASETVKG